MDKVIIADSSPIINLLKISRLNLLQQLYGKVIIPQGVFGEIDKPEFKAQADKVKASSKKRKIVCLLKKRRFFRRRIN